MSEKILRSIHLIISPTLFAIDKPELGFRGSLAAILTNTLLNLALIPHFGIIGAAVATSVSALIAALVNIFYISDYIKISLPWDRLLWSTLASGIMAISVFYLNSYTSSNIIGTIIGVLAGIIIYFVVLFLNPNIRGFFKTLVYDIEISSQ
ncbi:polysaccharide biosynthesis C-terminal domain-containing protein [Haloarcula marismortui]